MAAEFVTAMKTNEIPVGRLGAVDVRGMRIARHKSAGRTTHRTTRVRMSSAPCGGRRTGWNYSDMYLLRFRVRCTDGQGVWRPSVASNQGQPKHVEDDVLQIQGMASTYVIIGASLAGATAAITLREEGPKAP